MGVDSSAIFDCKFSRKELLELACKLEGYNTAFSQIFTFEKAASGQWKINTDEDGGFTEITGGWPFGLCVEDNGLLCLWNISRWKFILQHEKGHYDEFFASCRLVADLIGANRFICLSDYALANVDTSLEFDRILTGLGQPFDRNRTHDIVEGCQDIFLYFLSDT